MKSITLSLEEMELLTEMASHEAEYLEPDEAEMYSGIMVRYCEATKD